MYYHPSWHWGPLLAIIIVLAILIALFEVWMIIDVAINNKLSDKSKAWWIVGMVLIHPFVAIVYYFTDHRKR